MSFTVVMSHDDVNFHACYITVFHDSQLFGSRVLFPLLILNHSAKRVEREKLSIIIIINDILPTNFLAERIFLTHKMTVPMMATDMQMLQIVTAIGTTVIMITCFSVIVSGAEFWGQASYNYIHITQMQGINYMHLPGASIGNRDGEENAVGCTDMLDSDDCTGVVVSGISDVVGCGRSDVGCGRSDGVGCGGSDIVGCGRSDGVGCGGSDVGGSMFDNDIVQPADADSKGVGGDFA